MSTREENTDPGKGTETQTAEAVIEKIHSLTEGWDPNGSTKRKSGWVKMSDVEAQKLIKRLNPKRGEEALSCAVDCHQTTQGWVFISMARYHSKEKALKDYAQALSQSVLLMNLKEKKTPQGDEKPASGVLTGLRSIPDTRNILAFPGGVVEKKEKGHSWSPTGAY